MDSFNSKDFQRLGVCNSGIRRVERYGGIIENTRVGWNEYIDLYPAFWTAPIFTVEALHRLGCVNAAALPWQYARMAIIQSGIAELAPWANTLGPSLYSHAEQAAKRIYIATLDRGASAVRTVIIYAAQGRMVSAAHFTDAVTQWAHDKERARVVRYELAHQAIEILTNWKGQLHNDPE